MSNRAPNWFERQHIDGALDIMKNEGYLTKGMARIATGIRGNEVTWKTFGKGKATEMAPVPEERPVMNTGRNIIPATMRDYEANSEINVTDIYKMSENEKQYEQKITGRALGEKYDAILFDTLRAGTYTGIRTIGTATTAITPADLLYAAAQIRGKGINGMVYVALPYLLLGQLMMYKQISSADYTGADVPLRKELGAKTWMGMHIVPFPDDYFIGPDANSAYGFVWVKDAVGFATPTDAEGKIKEATRIDYEPRRKSWFVGATMSAACAILEPEGIRRLWFDNDFSPTLPA